MPWSCRFSGPASVAGTRSSNREFCGIGRSAGTRKSSGNESQGGPRGRANHLDLGTRVREVRGQRKSSGNESYVWDAVEGEICITPTQDHPVVLGVRDHRQSPPRPTTSLHRCRQGLRLLRRKVHPSPPRHAALIRVQKRLHHDRDRGGTGALHHRGPRGFHENYNGTALDQLDVGGCYVGGDACSFFSGKKTKNVVEGGAAASGRSSRNRFLSGRNSVGSADHQQWSRSARSRKICSRVHPGAHRAIQLPAGTPVVINISCAYFRRGRCMMLRGAGA